MSQMPDSIKKDVEVIWEDGINEKLASCFRQFNRIFEVVESCGIRRKDCGARIDQKDAQIVYLCGIKEQVHREYIEAVLEATMHMNAIFLSEKEFLGERPK